MPSIVTNENNSVGASFEANSQDWRQAMQQAVREGADLCRRLKLPESLACSAAGNSFPVFVPLEYLSRIIPGDPLDPLLLQVLPGAPESQPQPDFSADPLDESQAVLAPGLLHKYHGRALMITTGVCAVHCRYCFRREYPYAEAGPHTWNTALERLTADDSIEEVLLSGGDPLTLSDSVLADLVERLASIKHLKRLRIHTRLPIVIPQRVNDDLLAWLTQSRLTPIVVVHANHPNEIDQPTAAALSKLKNAGVLTLNQSVLLRGVNDNATALIELSRRLINQGVAPYYLHQLDRVRGAAHFEVDPEIGRDLIGEMRAALPGYAVPRFVQEHPGEHSKRVLA